MGSRLDETDMMMAQSAQSSQRPVNTSINTVQGGDSNDAAVRQKAERTVTGLPWFKRLLSLWKHEKQTTMEHNPYNDTAGIEARIRAVMVMKDLLHTVDEYEKIINRNRGIASNIRNLYKEKGDYVNKAANFTMSADHKPLMEMNAEADKALQNIARNLYTMPLLQRHLKEMPEELTEVNKAKIEGGKEAIDYIKEKGDEMISRLERKAEYRPAWNRAIDSATIIALFGLLMWFSKTGDESTIRGSVIFIAAIIMAVPYIVRGIEQLGSLVKDTEKKKDQDSQNEVSQCDAP